MTPKFQGLLNRLLNRLEKDNEKTEQTLADIQEKQHLTELKVKTLAMLPKKTCTVRFDKLESRTTDIENRLPNKREVEEQLLEKRAQKKKVNAIYFKVIWVTGVIMGILFILKYIQHLNKLSGGN